MKIQTLVLAALAAVSATVHAGGALSSPDTPRLAQVIAHLESKYQGEVTAIQLDAAGDKQPHYHVDMRFPQDVVARIDVDAATHDISLRRPGALPRGFATLPEIAALVSKRVPGQILTAQLDGDEETAHHYDVDVRLAAGKIARLKIDASTRAIGWRQPALADD